MTYEGSMAVCPLKRNDSYNPMRTPHLERSTEGFAEAKPDVPPSRTPEERDEQFETALHASRLRPSLRAMASRIVSGQGYAAVSTLTPQQPEMRTSRLGRSVRDPEGKPRFSMSQAKHYVPTRSHESADHRDPTHSGWHGQDQVLVRARDPHEQRLTAYQARILSMGLAPTQSARPAERPIVPVR